MIYPIIKWIGGKRQIMHHINNFIPNNINNFYDIFCGGGSVLINVLLSKNPNKVYAYDINAQLINMYQNIKNHPQKLYDILRVLNEEYFSIDIHKIQRTGTFKNHPKNKNDAMKSRELYYYYVRNKYNEGYDKLDIYNSAYFIFLNKTCFRGLYRIANNKFNVAYGNYKNPCIIDKNNLFELSKLIKNVIFTCMNFEQSLSDIKYHKNDVIYMDPPYYGRYGKYSSHIFDHAKLYDICKGLKSKYIMNNSDDAYVINTFKNCANIKYIHSIDLINSKKPDNIINEIIIYN